MTDLIIYKSSLLNSRNGVYHGFSARVGGVSNSPYNTLNLGLSVGDIPENVHKNRELFFQSLKSDPQQSAQGVQVHGNAIQIVDPPGDRIRLNSSLPAKFGDRFMFFDMAALSQVSECNKFRLT